MYALHNWQLVRIHGRDPLALLQGQITADVRALDDGTGVNGALCTPKGRMVASFGVARRGDDVLLSVPKDRVQALSGALAKYLPFFGCSIEALDWHGVGLTEPGSEAISIALGNGLFESWSESPAADAADGWEALRIEHNLPWVDTLTDQAFTPQQLNLQSTGGISFTKGCYTGQEVVARTEHLGKVKKFAHRVTLSGDCRPGDLSLEGRKVGTLCHVAGDHGIAVMDPSISACECPGGRVTEPSLPYPITSPIKRRSNR
ncbi:YgfZ/GcvT domain-containing protein [Litorivicinus lipolyticus]|uniref:CAF17-like 4Fe-4S cluster assembly/insertion protein YgfZ n=1 Tax=Litorivicinus lipolyticus TaxID=418701 RepID=UPI003B5C84EF